MQYFSRLAFYHLAGRGMFVDMSHPWDGRIVIRFCMDDGPRYHGCAVRFSACF